MGKLRPRESQLAGAQANSGLVLLAMPPTQNGPNHRPGEAGNPGQPLFFTVTPALQSTWWVHPITPVIFPKPVIHGTPTLTPYIYLRRPSLSGPIWCVPPIDQALPTPLHPRPPPSVCLWSLPLHPLFCRLSPRNPLALIGMAHRFGSPAPPAPLHDRTFLLVGVC